MTHAILAHSSMAQTLTRAAIGPAGWALLLLGCLLLPYAVIRSHLRSAAQPARTAPPRRAHLRSVLVQHAVLGLLALAVASFEDIELWVAAWPSARSLGLAALTCVALYVVMAPYRRRVAHERGQRMQLFAEATREERTLWMLVALSAGFWEELFYRGAITELLVRASGSSSLAIGVCATAFGLAHAHRGALAVVLTGVIGLAMHALVIESGSLYTAMAVHFVYDAAALLAYMRLADELGLRRADAAAS